MEREMEMPSKEVSLEAFIGFLVEPIINKYGHPNGCPSSSAAAHEEVAKQVQATVFLYNYYHRKQFPYLEFLDALTFCKTAVIMCTKLITYMGILKGTDVLATDFAQHATLTVKMVKEACDICESLNSSRTMPNTDPLPISKVAVFVIDASYEKCILSFGSITKGVCSLVEKNVDGFDDLIGGTQECGEQNKEQGSSKKSFRCAINTGERRGTKANGTMPDEREKFQQLAYAAVKEQTGIDQSYLKVFAVRVVYSLSKAKMDCKLYMMRCINDVPLKYARGTQMKWIPVRDALSSIEGPLLENVSRAYQASSTISYFHLRPYVNAIRDCLSRKCFINSNRISETFESAQYNRGQISVASGHQDCQANSRKRSRNKKKRMAPNTPCLNNESGKSMSDIGEESIDNARAIVVRNPLASPAADPYPSQHTLKHAENSIHKPLSNFEFQSTATGKLMSTTKYGEDTCKASGQFLNQYSRPAEHTFGATKQVSSTLNCKLHNARDMDQEQLDQNKVNQKGQSKDKSDSRSHVSGTSKQDVCHIEVGANAGDKILYAQSQKTHFTPFQSSEQFHVGNNLSVDEPTVKGLKFFKRHLRKKQKFYSSNSIITASMESSQNSESDPFLISSIITDPTKMDNATVLTIINSFNKQIEQRVANYKLENEQLHQKIDSLYKFVQETFSEAVNVCEEELPNTTIDKLQVALKNLANNQDIGLMKMNRELLSQYLSVADELEREVNKSFEKLSVATQESFTMFVKLHDWPTLLTMRDPNINQLICEVQQVTSECLTCKTMTDQISKLHEAQEKTKKIQQWYESCPSIIMQLQNFKDRAEYQWKALTKVASWSVEETMDIQKEKPESADLAALYCNRFQNLDYRLVQALEEWDHFKKELLNTVPELKGLLQIIK